MIDLLKVKELMQYKRVILRQEREDGSLVYDLCNGFNFIVEKEEATFKLNSLGKERVDLEDGFLINNPMIFKVDLEVSNMRYLEVNGLDINVFCCSDRQQACLIGLHREEVNMGQLNTVINLIILELDTFFGEENKKMGFEDDTVQQMIYIGEWG
ncbi:hypothetical protein [Jeotgalibacillus terrae]|uniref:Uncharacterized protein n=1 Tax=Jeotgalibacillus terrae TaxID=587735 RepID=A0ABW5ZLT3_9BACL|nr:hypothetical protein [Jeotgalibacillus terrae]MBM7578243.1 hypothetical protein [Jeotgalibacillus terrae]